MLNDLGKSAVREVISLVVLILGSGTLVFTKDLSGNISGVWYHGLRRGHYDGLVSIGPVMYGPGKGNDCVSCTEYNVFEALAVV